MDYARCVNVARKGYAPFPMASEDSLQLVGFQRSTSPTSLLTALPSFGTWKRRVASHRAMRHGVAS